jgi:DNA polymerase-1
VTLRGLGLDTMLASYLIDATSAHPLEDLALEHASYKALSIEDLCGKGVKATSLAEVPVDAALVYAGERADLVAQLSPILSLALDKAQLTDVYRSIELPLVPVLIAIERAGVRIDTPALAAQSQKIEQELAQRTAAIFAIAGGEFNINSPKQLADVLFGKLQLPVSKRTASKAPSTAVEVLENWHSPTRSRARSSSGVSDEIEGDLSRCAASWCIHAPGASTPRSTRRSPRLDG